MSDCRTFIVKLTSGCNLACSYCYYLVPKQKLPHTLVKSRMSPALLDRTISEICGLPWPRVHIVIHGGEPLLLGKPYLERAFASIRQRRGEEEVLIQLQTNGVLIDKEWIQLFQEYKVGVGISLDGPKVIHDLHRRNLGQQGSFESVMRAAKLMHDNGFKFGTLAVVTKESVNHVVEIYRFFFHNELGHLFYEIDFLPCRLVDPVSRSYDQLHTLSPEEWFTFMNAMFDLWIAEDRPEVKIRYFRNLIRCLVGGEPAMCEFMGGCGEFVTIEPEGDVFPCDNLLAFDELCFGNLAREPLSRILESDHFKYFLETVTTSKLLCKSCAWFIICHGGCVQDKYVLTKELVKPGYHCEAKKRLFAHAAKKIALLLD